MTNQTEVCDHIWEVSCLRDETSDVSDISDHALVLGHNSVLRLNREFQEKCHVHCAEKCIM